MRKISVFGAAALLSISAAIAQSLDFDEDGVGDETDQCPTMAGPVEDGGCPPMREVPPEALAKIDKLAESIAFGGNALLTQESLTVIEEISEVCRALVEGVHIDIHVYTDDGADEDANQRLSQDRGTMVKELIRGCTRPAAMRVFGEGAGEEPAVADEAPPPADRVVFKLFYTERVDPDAP